jgi:glycerophosphoryl diester phosphodiesterase
VALRSIVRLALVATAAVPVLAAAADDRGAGKGPKPDKRDGIVIGHRGASGDRPEHTLAAYRLAIKQCADYIEPDLVSTRDHVLVARHENDIAGTTDVADHPEFADRRTTKVIDGISITGWFTEDFTLAEIKTLRAKERLASRSHAFDGKFQVATLDEVIELAQRLGRELNRPIGIYPETKHPTYFRGIGLPLEEKLLASLDQHGWNKKDAPVFIQSFEQDNLRELRKKTAVRLIQLASSAKILDDAGLKDIASYADGIGPDKKLVIPVSEDGTPGPPTDLVKRAHALGLLVHVYTLRIDKEFLPAGYNGNAEEEFRRFRDAGIDGLFTDFPDVAHKVYGRR